jgi:hypothetical protein
MLAADARATEMCAADACSAKMRPTETHSAATSSDMGAAEVHATAASTEMRCAATAEVATASPVTSATASSWTGVTGGGENGRYCDNGTKTDF